MNGVNWWNDTDRGKRNILIKTCASDSFLLHKSRVYLVAFEIGSPRQETVAKPPESFLISAGTLVILTLFLVSSFRPDKCRESFSIRPKPLLSSFFQFTNRPTDERYVA
jgi:hypothetical protein